MPVFLESRMCGHRCGLHVKRTPASLDTGVLHYFGSGGRFEPVLHQEGVPLVRLDWLYGQASMEPVRCEEWRWGAPGSERGLTLVDQAPSEAL